MCRQSKPQSGFQHKDHALSYHPRIRVETEWGIAILRVLGLSLSQVEERNLFPAHAFVITGIPNRSQRR